MASGQAQVLRELDGGWLQCQDNQGVFFYNSVTQQSSVEVPNELRAQQQPQAAAATPQVQVLRELGAGWLQCRDAQGTYYYNQVTQQSSDDVPPELRALLQPPATTQSQAPVFSQQAQAAQGAPANQAKIKQQLGDWMICEDAQGEFYMNARNQQSFDQPPAELVQLYRASQQQKQFASQQSDMQHSAARPSAAHQQMWAQQQQQHQQQRMQYREQQDYR